jgi:alpha-tubulin suppressor-like RCC1 family protein
LAKLWLLCLFILSACNVANQPATVSATGVVDAPPVTSVSFSQIFETRMESGSVISFPVSLSAPLLVSTTVNYIVSGTTTGGVACGAGVDYITPTGSVTIPAGVQAAVISVQSCTDNLYEGDETLVLTISGTSPAMPIGTYGALTVRIQDAAIPPRMVFDVASSGSIPEGAAGDPVTVVTVDVELPYPSVQTVTAQIYATGTATENVDFSLSAHSVTFPPGVTTQSIDVNIFGDDFIEPNETITLSLYNVFNGSVGTQATHQLQIAQDEVPNTLQASVVGSPFAATEGTAFAGITVTVTGSMENDVLLTYTVDNSASVIAPAQLATFGADFLFPGFSTSTATVVIPADGLSTRNITIPVTINNDTLFEPSEEFVVTLLGSSDVSVVGGAESARVAITDNDAAPSVAFLSVAQTLAESATPGGIIVRLVNGSGVETTAGQDVVITFNSANQTSEGAVDWLLGASSLTIPRGSSRATMPVSALQDTVDEDNEFFDVSFNTITTGFVGAVGFTSHRVTITDMTPPARLEFTAVASALTETDTNAAVPMAVTLDRPSDRQIVLTYAVTGVTFTAAACPSPNDISTTGTVTIPAGTAMPYTLPAIELCGDTLYKGNRVALFTLQSASNALLGSSIQHTVDITEDEPAPDVTVAASAATVDEVTANVTFIVTVQPTAKAFTLSYATTGTTTVGSDHTLAGSGLINVAASTLVQNIPVNFQITDDNLPEDAETIIFTVSAGADAVLVTPSATMTIRSNDPLQLALGSRHACGLLLGKVKCWGHGPSLGAGLTANYGDAGGETVSALQGVSFGTGFTPLKIVAGRDFTCALSTTGTVKCWGLNTFGQLGQDRVGVAGQASEYIGDSTSEMGTALPVVPLGATALDIQTSAEADHACALLSSGRMKCWGRNNSGQLGYTATAGTCSDGVPDTTCQGDDFGEVANLPFLVFPTPGLTVQRMAVGDNHTCAQASDDQVYCWGDNTNGALGADLGTASITLASSTAVSFNAAFDASDIQRISAGANHTCVDFLVGADNESLCWGSGANGVLGQGNTNNAGTAGNPISAVATAIDYGTPNIAIGGIQIAGNHACFRDETQTAICWGANTSGQLGFAVAGPITSPAASTAVAGTYTEIYVGTDFSCGISGAFQFNCWGSNGSGQLGRANATATFNTPGTDQDFE